MSENETRDEAHGDAAPLARLTIHAQLAFERELNRLAAPYEPPHSDDYSAY